MPKMKSHSGMGKRARLTGGGKGKVVKEQANRRHKLEVKSSRRKRRLDGTDNVSRADIRRVKKLLGR